MSPTPPPISKWRAGLVVGLGAVMFLAYVLFAPLHADAPVRSALKKALGAEAGQIEISDVAAFTDIDGPSERINIVCGWAGKSRRRAFAGIVRHTAGGRRNNWNRAYWLKELVIQPPPGRPWLEREKELLDACFARPGD